MHNETINFCFLARKGHKMCKILSSDFRKKFFIFEGVRGENKLDSQAENLQAGRIDCSRS